MSSKDRHSQQQVLRAQLTSKAILRPDEQELYEMTQLAGLTVDQEIFKILLDLLKMNVSPEAIVLTLRSMCSPHSNSGPHNNSQSELSALRGGTGEPYANVTNRSDSSRRYDTSDSQARSFSGERHHISSQENSRVRGASSSSSRVNPDSYSSSQQRQRQADKKSSSTSSASYNVDNYVTRRPRSTVGDVSSLEEREKANKKRYSQR